MVTRGKSHKNTHSTGKTPRYPMNTHFTKEKPRKTQVCKARPCSRQFVSSNSSRILIKYMVTRGKSHKNTHSTGKTPRYPMNTHFTKEKPLKTQICKARPCSRQFVSGESSPNLIKYMVTRGKSHKNTHSTGKTPRYPMNTHFTKEKPRKTQFCKARPCSRQFVSCKSSPILIKYMVTRGKSHKNTHSTGKTPRYTMNTHFAKEKPRKTQFCKARPCSRQFGSCKSSPILIKYMVTRGKSHKNTHSTGKTPRYTMNTHFTKEKPRKTQVCKARPCSRQFVSCKSSPILIKYMVTRGKSHKNTHSTGKTPRYPMNTHFTKEKP